MSRTLTKLLLLPTVATLAACGGGDYGNTAGSAPTEAVVVGANPLGLTASFDEDTEVITVNGRAYDDFADRNGRLIANRATSIPGESRGDFNDLAIHGETSSGDGTVFLVSSTLEEFVSDDEFEPFFVTVSREGTVAIPAAGSAEYTGTYLGSRFVDSASDDVTFFQSGRIFGDVALTADFGDTSTISGMITNRTGGREDEWADMAFELATIGSDGGFAGAVTGGGRIGESTSGGAYSGLLTGADAGEAIGGLSIQHQAGDTEAGVFIAE